MEPSAGERMILELLTVAHVTPPDQLAEAVARHAPQAGIHDTAIYMVDLQQVHLVPMPGEHVRSREPLSIDGTLAGLAYRTVTIRETNGEDGLRRLWVPLLDGTERLGVLEASVAEADDVTLGRCRMLASLVALVIVSKRSYSDSYAMLRRAAPMELAAEMVWAFLPPLTFASDRVVVSAVLEPAYRLGGDAFDYSLNGDVLHVAMFDAMGHDLSSGLMASVAMAAFRNARRGGARLPATVRSIDAAVAAEFGHERFLTGVLAELDTATGLLRWVSCGHHPPLLLREGKVVKTLDQPPRLPLGLGDGDDAPPAVHEEQLQRGDRLLVYSDGVVEARAPGGELFGAGRLADFVIRQSASGMPAPEVLRRLVRAILDQQDGRLDDDATVMLVEWGPDDVRQLLV